MFDTVNVLKIANTEATSKYLRNCRVAGAEANPARFPKKLPDFFIKLLTEPNDIVLDIFAGSNTTGEAAEDNQRRWIAFEIDRQYVAGSALRFIESTSESEIKFAFDNLMNQKTIDVDIFKRQISLGQTPPPNNPTT